jgi:hypothetical protein
VVAKVVLIVDHVPAVNRFPRKPLVYNVIWKTVIYVVAALVVRYIEHLIRFVGNHDSIAEANRAMLSEVVWPHFWAVQMWLCVLFLMYCTIREVTRVLGRDRVRQMFFGPPALRVKSSGAAA